MARTVRREAAAAYLRQAEEFFDSARANFEAGRLNVAGFDAIQSLINANDALTAHFLGLGASADHREAIRLHVDVVRILGDASQRGVLKRSLDQRSDFGYLGTRVRRPQAEKLITDAARFLEWVRRAIGPPPGTSPGRRASR